MDWQFDRFHSALIELRSQLRNYVKGRTGLEIPGLYGSMDILIRDWRFLNLLWKSIQETNNATTTNKQKNLEEEKEEEEGKSLPLDLASLKIEAAIQNISWDLNFYLSEIKKIPMEKKLLKLVELGVVDCQRQTDNLITEIEEAVVAVAHQHYQISRPPPVDFKPFWTCFIDSVKWSIETTIYLFDDDDDVVDKKQVSASMEELGLIQHYVFRVIGPVVEPSITTHACLKRVASAIVYVANRAFSCWFNYKTGRIQMAKSELIQLLEDLQYEIHPTNPQVMESHLHFIRKLSEVSAFKISSVVCHFGDYVLSERAIPYLKRELESLLTYVFETVADKELKSSSRGQSFFEELNPVLVEAVSLMEVLRKGDKLDPPPCADLLTKLCLLRAEFSLKKLLHSTNRTITGINFSGYVSSRELNDVHRNLRTILKNLTTYLEIMPQEKDYWEKILPLIEELEKVVPFLSQSLKAKEITFSMIKNPLFQLLLKIVFFKADSVSMELLLSNNGNATFMTHGKHLLELLLQQLKLFTLIFPSQQMKDREDVEMIFVQIEAFARGVTRFARSFIPKKISQDMINEMILLPSQLLDNVRNIRPKFKEIAPQFPRCNFPKIHPYSELAFVDFLIKKLWGLLNYDSQLIAPVKPHIEEIQLHLNSMSKFLMKISELDVQHPKQKDFSNRVVELAYKVEYAVHFIEINENCQHFLWLYDLLEELRIVAEQLSQIHASVDDAKVQNVTEVSHNLVSRGKTPATHETVVRLFDEEEVIIDRLTRGSSKRGIVSIVGMPGMGKTTLARKVYNTPSIMYHFHRHAWCTVSQVYEKRELLLEILGDTHGVTNEIHKMSNEDLQSKLRKCLLGNKYLIVMDDLWDAGAWNDLQSSFPDDDNGSRILITSRLCDVALEIGPNCNPHHIRPFSDAESWKLLEQKIFQVDNCPEELLLVGQEIAQKCKGLPLAVVAISGLLQRTEKRKEFWGKIAQSLSSEIMKDRCMEILELSYQHLPGYLKACFLYLGVFPEDKDIPVNKLIQLWLAEGFIKRTELKGLEDVAEDYLMDLINRSLVMISKRRCDGKVKACRLHDLIRDLCRSKIKEENFFQRVTRFDEPYASFPVSDYGFELYFDHTFEPVTYEAYRLSMYLKRNHFAELRPYGLTASSLIFFALPDSEPRCPYDISFVGHNFKFLCVLDFECINMGISFPAEIGLLVRLRYLAVCGFLRSIPQSIAKLRNLETLVVKGLRGKIVLPSAIWRMTRLRHLHVNNHVAFHFDEEEELGDCIMLYNLVSFSRPSLSCGEHMQKIIKRFPNLCKLRCIFFEPRGSSGNTNQFPMLNFLTRLESLNMFYYGRTLSKGEFVLPLNLKKLTLSNFCLPWNHISAIGRLQNLQVLKLVSGAFEGHTWEMRKEEFQQLKFLKLDSLNVVQWNASSDHLPKLERLILQNCKDLEKIPYDFVDIATLYMIEVHWCGQSAEESANDIAEATGEIKVLISRS